MANLTQPTAVNYLLFERPCCPKWVYKKMKIADYVISLKNGSVLRKIEPVVCPHGRKVMYKFYPGKDVALIHHYVSTTGKHIIDIRWKHENVSVEEVVERAKEALGLFNSIVEVYV